MADGRQSEWQMSVRRKNAKNMVKIKDIYFCNIFMIFKIIYIFISRFKKLKKIIEIYDFADERLSDCRSMSVGTDARSSEVSLKFLFLLLVNRNKISISNIIFY